MKFPTIQGIIKRRILVNYRVEPEIIRRILPPRFHPKLHNGKAIAGICLIRLEHARPRFAPKFLGFASENAAHRIAVVWEGENGTTREGVYVPRRDTDSLINTTVGGKLFSGVYHQAKFEIEESTENIDFKMESKDGEIKIAFAGKIADNLPAKSIFSSLAEASRFFEKGSLGYSPAKNKRTLDGISLQIKDWKVSAFELNNVYSSFFSDETKFPKGSVEFDHALYMHDVPHEWQSALSIEA